MVGRAHRREITMARGLLCSHGVLGSLALAVLLAPSHGRAGAAAEVHASAPPRPRGGPEASATAIVGSGVSMAPGPSRAIANRSPLCLTVDAGFFHPEIPWLELSPAVLLELERGVGFGLAFRVRAFVPTRRMRVYGLAGVPAFLAPNTLLGAQVGIGGALPLHRHVALAAEVGPSVFFAGADLVAGGVLAKVDGSVGMRVTF